MNRKSPEDKVDTTRPAKVYLTDALWEMVNSLVGKTKTISQFFREQIALAWLVLKGGALVVPLAAPSPAYSYVEQVDGNGKKLAVLTKDNLVAVPHAQYAHWKSTSAMAISMVRDLARINEELTQRLYEKDVLINEMLGFKGTTTRFVPSPRVRSEEEEAQAQAEAERYLQWLEWCKKASALSEQSAKSAHYA